MCERSLARKRKQDAGPNLLPLLKQAARCITPLALAILLEGCFGSSQEPKHLVACCLMLNAWCPVRIAATVAARRALRRLLQMRMPVQPMFYWSLLSELTVSLKVQYV